ncbi:MAG: hypothetical protein ACW96X_04360 [Promethearchaeota archaeon]|jgi:hypothetical protein
MRKGYFWYIFIGSLFLLILLLIFNAEFWKDVFNAPSFSGDTAVTILIFVFSTSLIIGIILWINYRNNFGQKGDKDLYLHSKTELGICLGSTTSNGLTIQGKSKGCPFDDFFLVSMLEYSAVLYQHGEIGNIYGPFPMTKIETNNYSDTSYEGINFISFGFNVKTNAKSEVLSILLFYYSERYDELIMARKNRLNNLLLSITNDHLTTSSFNQDKINYIENEIRLITVF